MKLLTVLLFILISCTSLAQSQKSTLYDIKNKYQLIKELINTNTLRQYYTDYQHDKSVKNGSLTFYFNSSELKHIIHKYTQGNTQYKDEYYIWDDQLFFQYSTTKIKYTDYEKKTYQKKRKLINITLTIEERFYFKNRNTIKCQFKSFENRSNNPNKIKTNYVSNIDIECNQAQNVLKKFDLLFEFQKTEIGDPCNLPKSITITSPLDQN
ncbi:hypothetical protein [Aquimarina longa]|uniref:hypothetical protein n=1 Tax=Aquimarina longa TaxID=1080221 RepID=UPI000780C106|nr:hypothetical protein [Aquimarina longa]